MRGMAESGDHRPTAILAAARQALLTRGLSSVRVADIAELAHVSSGSVHYHFDTKDEVLVATFRWSAEQMFAQVEAQLADAESAPAQMGRLLSLSVPESGLLRDEYVIWLQFWAEVLTRPSLLEPCEAVSERWRSYFHQVVQEGVSSGAFHPVSDPAEVADRLIALVDGLGFETVIGYRWTSPERMRQLLARFASEQLGVPITVDPLSVSPTP
jgi:AcrR family transcriptional regulator